jgi:protein involved in temperature-dependent protein secretion
MGRLTEWVAGEGGLERGAGQHVFLAGGIEMGLLEVREMSFELPETGEGDGHSDRS